VLRKEVVVTIMNLNEFARALAIYARSKMTPVHRGALLIRCTDDDNTVAAVFGNDNYRADYKARCEVAMVRQHLREAKLEELGFGLSQDGHSWTLLVRTDGSQFKTEVGRRFQVELLKVYLDDLVWRSWWTACGVAPDSPERLKTGEIRLE
jgi:hypothetical protein